MPNEEKKLKELEKKFDKQILTVGQHLGHVKTITSTGISAKSINLVVDLIQSLESDLKNLRVKSVDAKKKLLDLSIR